MDDSMPGDNLIPGATVVLDRRFALSAAPEQVWPWFVQLGKNRAGWYLPRPVERFVPPRRRALRSLEPTLQLAVGDRIDDWGGRDAYFEVAIIEAPTTLAFISRRGHLDLSWTITLAAASAPPAARTQVRLRLRLAGVRRPWLARSVGDWFDAVTVAGLAAGLQERLRPDGRTAA